MKKYGCVLLLVLCCVIAGCGKKAKLTGLYPVKGKLTLDGSPVEGALVTLTPVNFTGDARAASGETGADGTFIVQTMDPGDGAFPGEYVITVTKREVVGKMPTAEEFDAARDAGQRLIVNSKNIFPAKYEKTGTSGLKVTVVEGKNEDLILDLP